MAGLHVYRSNRLESLADSLATLLASPSGGVLEPERVVVQSLGMRRWLAYELAARLGVTMNVEFPFPAAFAREVFRAAFGEDGDDGAFAREVLPWRVLDAFRRFVDTPAWEPLNAYLQGEMSALKRYQLAQKIAAVFDRYLAYRPELLLEWGSSRRSGDWQAELWRELIRGRHKAHPPALLQQLRQLPAPAPLAGLPSRLAIFGISSLPPFYLHLIQTTARHHDMHLFLLEPTDQYWGDIQSRQEQDRRLAASDATADDLHLDSGNPLLASLGKIGRDFTRLVQDLEPISQREDFAEPARATLLGRVQEDIFTLCNRPLEEREILPQLDHSIRIQCCHSPMREVEVLHDQLLDLFERIPGLAPRDILVAMPDAETYAPFIEAVFGCPEDARMEIPFSVADRSARAECGVAETFLRLLDLHGSRFTAPAVLALLDNAALRSRFSLVEGDLVTIRDWVAASGIRWGIDADHRASLNLPAFAGNTWRAGLERLLLGYALPGDEHTLFDGILPMRDVEGARAETLGNFAAFASELFDRIPRLGVPRPVQEWARLLSQLVRTFFDDSDEWADEVRRLRDVIVALAEDASLASFTSPVEFEIIRAHLGTVLADTDSGGGFLAGRVTFCSLKPMRAIPFKVICLLGMNDNAFPRRDTALAFDAMAAGRPRRGDRSRRDDDRHLFLEAILSAREALYLSYCGQSLRDNTESPPSVVVSELLDYLEQNYAVPEGKLRSQLVTRHRLQAFSPAYFTAGPELFSYSAEGALAGTRGRGERTTSAGFAANRLPEPGPEWFAVEVASLADFFAHPPKYFCRQRLRLAEPDDLEALEETEPLSLGGLVRYELGQRLVEDALVGTARTTELLVTRASGVLPAGYAGDSAFATLDGQAVELAEKIRAAALGAPRPPATVDVTIGLWRVTGLLRGLHEAGQLRYRAAKLKPRDLLRAWVHHLALQFVEGEPHETWLFATDAAWKFAPVADAPQRLAALLDLYRQGLCEPLPLFPETSLEYARRRLRPTKAERADPLAEARKKWAGGEYHPGERADVWMTRCFPQEDVLDARWRQLAEDVFGPLLAARMEVSS